MAGRFSVEAVFKAVDRVTAPVSRMQNRVGKFTRSMNRGLRSVNRTLGHFTSGLRRGAGAALKFASIGIGAVTGAVVLLVREFSKIENAEAAFTPLLGGAKKAKEAVQALNDTAASTPFQFDDLASAASQLLPVMEGDIGRMVKTVRMLGDTAGGNAQKLDSITRGFTKAMLKGKVDMESLNMIGEAGVPIFTELADSMGTKVNEAFFKMISAGKVSTRDLTKAFQKMTSEGGIFFGGMEIASKTTTGLFSTLKDNISLTAAKLGGILAPTIKELIKGTTGITQQIRAWVKNNEELIRSRFTSFVESAKNGALKLWEAIKKLNDENGIFDSLKKFISAVVDTIIFLGEHGATIAKVIAGVVALSIVLNILAVVMTVVNLVMAANPMTLIIIGILLLIAAIAAAIYWWDELSAAFMNSGKSMDAIIVGIALLTGPIGWIIGAALLIVKHWEPIKEFFRDLWDGVVSVFDASIDKIMSVVDKVKGAASGIVNTISSIGKGVGSFFGFGGEVTAGQGAAAAPQMVSPQDRVANSINEQRTTSTSEVTIRDESGRAEVTAGRMGPGLTLLNTGAM